MAISFKKLNKNETNNELKNRHSKYYYFTKHLYEVINLYGFDAGKYGGTLPPK